MEILLDGKLNHLNIAANVFSALTVNSKKGLYVEIGAHNGRSMSAFGNILKHKVNHLHMIGYDVFDLETDEFHNNEDNGMGGGNYDKCIKRVKKLTRENVTFELIKGYTTDTLTTTIADWAYIDGGHSYETVKWDHKQLKDSKVIVFDDSDLEGVNQYLWEIKDKHNLYSLYDRQAVIINDDVNFDFSAIELEKFQGHNPTTYQSKR